MRADRSVWLERLLVLVGTICLGWWTTATVHGWYFRSQQVSLFDSLTRTDASRSLPAVPAPAKPAVARDAPPDPVGLVGMIDVPRLGISTPVISGDDAEALDLAVGHLSDTPLPWERGNSAVAAHRDGIFRPLQQIRRGDLVRMRTTHGDFEYVVRGTKIVQPDDLSVLDPGRTDSLTLITCYPFGYIGHAPQRFVVRAERVSTEPQPPAPPATALTGAIVASAPIESARRVTKPRKAQSAKVAPRVAPRTVHKRAAASNAQLKPVNRARAAAHDASKGKEERPKKRKWYRLFF
jgi:sortase A